MGDIINLKFKFSKFLKKNLFFFDFSLDYLRHLIFIFINTKYYFICDKFGKFY